MLSEAEVRSLIDGVFEREALAIGGMFATCEITEGTAGRLVRSLEATRAWTLRLLDGRDREGAKGGEGPHLSPHPDIEEFLGKLTCPGCSG